MKEGGMEQAVESCYKSQKMSSGKYHHLLPPWELISVPFHVEAPLFTNDICLKPSAQTGELTRQILTGRGVRLEQWLEGGLAKWRVGGKCRWRWEQLRKARWSGGWGTAENVSDGSSGRKSKVCQLGAMRFWLHAYHFRRPVVKCSLLLCTPSTIFLSVSFHLTRGEVDHFRKCEA